MEISKTELAKLEAIRDKISAMKDIKELNKLRKILESDNYII